MGANLGQGVGALKRGGGLEPPYELCTTLTHFTVDHINSITIKKVVNLL